MTEADRLSPRVWNDIYRAIQNGASGREVFQGLVTERDTERGYVWVRELSSDPIEVVGHDHELTYFENGARKAIRIPPAVPDIGDIVTLVRTTSDQFKCVGTQQTTRKWNADPLLGLIQPDSITERELAPGAVTNTEVSDTASIAGHKLNWALGTTPPGSPQNGDIWIYTGTGFHWMFVYDNSEATYKWKFVGGGSLDAAISTDQTYSQGVSFVDATGAGPTVTLPRAGDYEIEFSCNVYVSAQASSSVIEAAANASSGTWDSTAAGGIGNNGQHYSTGGVPNTISMVDVVRGVSASATVKIQYRSNLGGTAHTRWRLIRARPIKVI